MHFIQRMVATGILLFQNLFFMTMVHEFHTNCADWPASGVFGLLFLVGLIGLIWGHGNKDM